MVRVRYILITLVILAGATASRALAQATSLTVPYTMDTLANGLRVFVPEDHSVPTVTMNVWYHVGSGDERPGRTGFAHLFEHLMFMGSEHAPYPAFDRLLEGVGASNNGDLARIRDRVEALALGPSGVRDLYGQPVSPD